MSTMKTLLSIFLLAVLNPTITCSNDFEKAMSEALKKMSEATSIHDFSEVANQFDRIANVKNDNWLPLYHAAYSRIMMAAMTEDIEKKDIVLDAAQQNLHCLLSLHMHYNDFPISNL